MRSSSRSVMKRFAVPHPGSFRSRIPHGNKRDVTFFNCLLETLNPLVRIRSPFPRGQALEANLQKSICSSLPTAKSNHVTAAFLSIYCAFRPSPMRDSQGKAKQIVRFPGNHSEINPTGLISSNNFSTSRWSVNTKNTVVRFGR